MSPLQLLLILSSFSMLAAFFLIGWRLIFRRNVHLALSVERGDYYPKVGVIVPCRGVDPGFEENMLAMLRQDYPSYHVVFVVDSLGDAAYPILARTVERSKTPCRVVISAGMPGSSGKIAALVKGVSEVDGDAEVLAFADTDTRPHPLWLRDLTGPLASPEVGAATGYRWYFPTRGGFWSVIRSAWSAIGLDIAFTNSFNFAWGGSLALRRETFEGLRVAEAWRGVFSDDLVLTQILKRGGYRVQFLPQCISASFEECDRDEFLEWATRQIKLIRIYCPRLWRLALLTRVFLNSLVALGAALCLQGLVYGDGILLPGVLMASQPLSWLVSDFIRFSAVKKAMSSRQSFYRYPAPYILASLIVPWFTMALYITSAFDNRISWRGATYYPVPLR